MQAALLPTILAAAGAGLSFIGQRKQAGALEDAAQQQEAAAEQAVRIGQMNAARQEQETAETVRRETVAAEEAESLRKARVAASGGGFGGSSGAFLEEQADREREYIDWLEKSGASVAEIERQRGALAGMEGTAQAKATEAQAKGLKLKSWGSLISGGQRIYDIYNPAGP